MKITELDHSQVLQILPDRNPEAHKGDFGRILLLCGSRGYTGAAALAAMGALRCGAGLVYLGVPECIYAVEAMKLTEPIVFPLFDKNGKLSAEAIPEIIERLSAMDAVLIGPGLGCSKGTFAVVKTVLENFNGPVVLDADGINVLAGHIDILRERTAPIVITPHPGEFQRIAGQVDVDRLEAAAKFASDTGAITLLKGYRTVITDGVEAYINTTGNPGMAVGGSGDVLAGLMGGLIAQGLGTVGSMTAAVYIHGYTADGVAEKMSKSGMLPSDVVDELAYSMRAFEK